MQDVVIQLGEQGFFAQPGAKVDGTAALALLDADPIDDLALIAFRFPKRVAHIELQPLGGDTKRPKREVGDQILERLPASDPIADFHTIQAELQAYGHNLADRPQIVALNKVDAAGLEGMSGESGQSAEEIAQALQPYTAYPVLIISAVSRVGLDALLQQVWQVLEAAEPSELPSELPSLS